MTKLTCAFGSKWGRKGCGPCAKCRAYAQQLEEEFERRVFWGEYDADGYKPGERKR